MKKYLCLIFFLSSISLAAGFTKPAKPANAPPPPEIITEPNSQIDKEIIEADESGSDEFIKNEDLGEKEILFNENLEVDNTKPKDSKVEVKGNDEDRDKNFADQEEKQNAEMINKETAQKLGAEKRLKEIEKNEHYQIVPYYRNAKAPKLQKKLRDGGRVYTTKPSPQNFSGSIRLGPFSPTQLNGDFQGNTFKNIYGSAQPFSVAIDFEWQFFQKAGKLGLQSGLGFFTVSGNGRFKNNPTLQADEIFSLYVFPINTTLMYRGQFYDKQPIAPFGGVGVDYFGMLESRDDKTNLSQKIKYGGGAAWHWTAGIQFQLDSLDREVIWQIDQDYGINHIYLIADVRQIFGLSSIYDFSALYYEGGFLFEF